MDGGEASRWDTLCVSVSHSLSVSLTHFPYMVAVASKWDSLSVSFCANRFPHMNVAAARK